MEQENIQELDDTETYDEVELFGRRGLFSNGRIDRACLPKGLYVYDLRGANDDPGQPATVENIVGINYAGTVILAEPLNFGGTDFLSLGEDMEELNFVGGECTIGQFYGQRKESGPIMSM